MTTIVDFPISNSNGLESVLKMDYDMINFQIETENDVTNLKTLVDSIKQQTAKYDADEKKKDPKHKDKKLSLSLPRYFINDKESDCSAIFNSKNFENIFNDTDEYIMNINLDFDLKCNQSELECLNEEYVDNWLFNCGGLIFKNMDIGAKNLVSVTAPYDSILTYDMILLKHFVTPGLETSQFNIPANLAFIFKGFEKQYHAQDIHNCLYDDNEQLMNSIVFYVQALDGYQYDKDSSFAKTVKDTTTPPPTIVDKEISLECTQFREFYKRVLDPQNPNTKMISFGFAQSLKPPQSSWWIYFTITVTSVIVVVIVFLMTCKIKKRKNKKNIDVLEETI